MAMSSGHFAKYRDFINLHLPTGFPVRIEIPLFRVLHAKITFGNIFALETPVENVLTINDEIELACVIDDSIFAPPPGYEVIGKQCILSLNLVIYFVQLQFYSHSQKTQCFLIGLFSVVLFLLPLFIVGVLPSLYHLLPLCFTCSYIHLCLIYICP